MKVSTTRGRGRGRSRGRGAGRGALSRPYQPISSSANNQAGTAITIRRTELLKTLTVKVPVTGSPSVGGFISLLPSSTVMPWLRKLFEAYSTVVWHKFHVYFKPMFSANTDGRVVYSIDVDGRAQDPDSRAKVLEHAPVLDHQIWVDSQGAPLIIPQSLLQTRKRYLVSAPAPDSTIGSLLYWIDGVTFARAQAEYDKDVGEFWVDYSVSLAGPR